MKLIAWISLLFACSAYVGCSKSAKTEHARNDATQQDTAALTSPLSGYGQKAEEPDVSIDSGGEVLPRDCSCGVSILIPASYRSHQSPEIQSNLSGLWLDFYRHEGKFYMLEAEVLSKPGFDDCSGDSTLIVHSSRESIVLIKGVGLGSKSDTVQSLVFDRRYVAPGEQFEFVFMGVKYQLLGEGLVPEGNTDHKQGNWDNVKRYRLFVKSQQEAKEQLLIAMPEFSDTRVEIVWIGDMDNDNKPDFMFEASPHYETKKIVLFLSSKAENGNIVKCVGISEYNYDC